VRRKRRRIKILGEPKTEMPVQPINIPIVKSMGYHGGGGDDFYLTSAYCDRDQIQWIYHREIARGLSTPERMRCDCCGADLYVSKNNGQFMSSTTIPEVVGWVRHESSKILTLALIESSLEITRDVLPDFIRRHDFSGRISKIKLYQSSYASPMVGSSNKNELLSNLQLLDTLSVILKKKKKLKIVVREEKLEESPLFVSPALRKKHEKQLRSYLENARRMSSKRKTTTSSGPELKLSATDLKTLSESLDKHLNSFFQWKRRAGVSQPIP